jgi:hypothetical protein
LHTPEHGLVSSVAAPGVGAVHALDALDVRAEGAVDAAVPENVFQPLRPGRVRGGSIVRGVDALDIPPPVRGEYQAIFLQALRAKGELAIDRVQLESVPRMTPGDTIEPYFILEWRIAKRRSLLTSYKSVMGREVANHVTWDDIDCAFPFTKSLEEYSLTVQVFAGTAMSDYVADSRFSIPLLAEFARPVDFSRWVAIFEVQHCDHVKLAKRHRVPTRAAIYFNTDIQS